MSSIEATNQSIPEGTANLSYTSLLQFRAWLVGVVVVCAVFALQPFYPSLIGPLSNVLPTLLVGNAFVSCLFCLKKYGLRLRTRFDLVWPLFTVGFCVWVVAEATWAFYYFVLQIVVPYPSIADIFYTSGYFPVIAGAAIYLDTFRVAISRRRLIVAVAATGLALALCLSFVVPIELAANPALTRMLTDLSYPILDLILVSLAIFGLVIFHGGRMARWWLLFGGAACMYVIGDELFLYQTSIGTYYNGGIDDLIFLIGYLTFALAFFSHRKEL